MVSASFLLFTNIRQGGLSLIISIISLNVACALGGNANSIPPTSSSCSGNEVSTTSCVVLCPVAIIGSPSSLDNHLDTSEGLPTVAERPILCTFLPESASSLESPIDNCQPLSLAAKS